MKQTFSSDVIVALDFKNLEETLAFLAPFRGHDQLYLKVGMELYLQNGPQVLVQSGYAQFPCCGGQGNVGGC